MLTFKKLPAALLTAILTASAAVGFTAAPAPAHPSKNITIKQPSSQQVMQVPIVNNFHQVKNPYGYTLAVPAALGSHTLADYPQVNGPMMVFARDKNTLMAVNVIDYTDTVSYKPVQPLPDFSNKKILCKWQHPTTSGWYCTLSRHTDFIGDKMLLQAKSNHNGKTYELLYVFPFAEYEVLLPQVLYSVNSFKYLN